MSVLFVAIIMAILVALSQLFIAIWREFVFLQWNQLDAQFFEFIEYHSTCFGRPFRPSSGVQDCTYSIKYTRMSYRLVDCLLAGTRWNSLACSQRTCIICTWCCI